MPEQLVIVGTFDRVAEADFAAATLTAAGVPVFTSSGHGQGIELLVRETDRPRAQEALQQARQMAGSDLPGLAAEPADAPDAAVRCCCPHCGRWLFFRADQRRTVQRCGYCMWEFLIPAGLPPIGRLPIIDATLAGKGVSLGPPATGVPRRFSVGAMLALVALFGIVFATLASLDAPPVVFAVVAVLFAGIGLAQAFLFGGQKPREASILAGAVLLPIEVAVAVIVVMLSEGFGLDRALPQAFLGALCSLPGGLLVGYLFGTLAAGVFLLMKRSERKGEEDQDEAADEDAPAEGPAASGPADAMAQPDPRPEPPAASEPIP